MAWMAAGLALVLAALFVPLPGNLAWGPALFRVLLAGHGIVLILWGKHARASRHAARSSSPVARRADGQRATGNGRAAFAALTALTVVALALRLINLNSCLWFDELTEMLDFVRPPFATIFTSFPNQNQHLLYSLMAHASFDLFGESAWALRLPAVFFGLASIWALFFLARRLMGSGPALAACALMTFSYHHIWFSQNARGYTGLLFSATLATWLYLEALDRRRWHWWFGYALALFVGFWVHMTIAFVAAAHGLLYLAMRARPKWGARPGHDVNPETEAGWQPIAAWLLAGSLTLQAYALTLPQILGSAIHEVSLPSEWLNPLWVLREFVLGFSRAWFGPVAVLLAAAFLAAGYASLARKDWRAAVLMAAPAVLGGGTMIALQHNLWPRFFFFAMGFGVVVVIEGAMASARLLAGGAGHRSLWPAGRRQETIVCPTEQPARARRLGLALASVLVVASAATVPRCYLPKQDFTGARDFVEHSRRPGEPVVAVGLAGRVYHDYYAPQWAAPETPGQLGAILRQSPEAWLVYTLPIEMRAYHPAIWRAIETDFDVVKVFRGTLHGGDVYVCRARPSAVAEARGVK